MKQHRQMHYRVYGIGSCGHPSYSISLSILRSTQLYTSSHWCLSHVLFEHLILVTRSLYISIMRNHAEDYFIIFDICLFGDLKNNYLFTLLCVFKIVHLPAYRNHLRKITWTNHNRTRSGDSSYNINIISCSRKKILMTNTDSILFFRSNETLSTECHFFGGNMFNTVGIRWGGAEFRWRWRCYNRIGNACKCNEYHTIYSDFIRLSGLC